ncbi:hypothetical protein, partial [Klebsiella quasipneumoniae]|uniref:hypothetical protein n=1 Tax=Klebsiella quasipneumoniae TaxID=1463165 RepID=UPI003BA07886
SRKLSRKTELFVFAFKKNPVPKGAGFFAVWGIFPRWRCAYRGYGSNMELRPSCGADKICSTDSGKNIA